jgi:hypothetical protein
MAGENVYYMIHSRVVDRCVEIAASSEVCNITIYVLIYQLTAIQTAL